MEDQIQTLADASLSWLSWIGPYVWLQAMIIVFVSLILAIVSERIIVTTVGKLVKKTNTQIDDEIVEALRRPLFVSIFFVGLAVATYRLELSPTLTSVTLSFLGTIATFIWLGFMIRLAGQVLTILSRISGRYEFVQPSTLPLFDNSAKLALILGALYFVFLAWGINVSALLASAGIVGLALSFGAQDALANIFGGMSILADSPYKVGDYITLDTGERGEVTHIGLRSTRMLTRDDVEISIPNSVMGTRKSSTRAAVPTRNLECASRWASLTAATGMKSSRSSSRRLGTMGRFVPIPSLGCVYAGSVAPAWTSSYSRGWSNRYSEGAWNTS